MSDHDERPESDVLAIGGPGHTSSFWSPLVEKLPPELAIWPVQLPGRQERHNEEPYSNVADAVAELEAIVASQGTESVVGHCHGGRLAVALCSRPRVQESVRRLLLVQPYFLTQTPPELPAPGDTDALVAWMRTHSDVPPEILGNTSLFAIFERFLVADFTMLLTPLDPAEAALSPSTRVELIVGNDEAPGAVEAMQAAAESHGWQSQVRVADVGSSTLGARSVPLAAYLTEDH